MMIFRVLITHHSTSLAIYTHINQYMTTLSIQTHFHFEQISEQGTGQQKHAPLTLQEGPKQHNIDQPEGQPGSCRMESLWGKFTMSLMNVFCSCFSWHYLRDIVSVLP